MSSIRDFSELFSHFYSHGFWINQYNLFQQYQRFTIPVLKIILPSFMPEEISALVKRWVFLKYFLNVDIIGWCHNFYSQI